MRAVAQPSRPAELAYRRIRADILFGRLPPGRKLKLDRLREDYTASVSTLREILSRLSSEKLVVAEGQRGFEVAPVSAKNLKEIAALRRLLEGTALEQSFERRALQACRDGRADGSQRPGRDRAMEAV
jgi:DNA-binding GntR family transcriptional regulator